MVLVKNPGLYFAFHSLYGIFIKVVYIYFYTYIYKGSYMLKNESPEVK